MKASFRPLRPSLLLLALGAVPAAVAADAPELYHQFCSVCHGDNGDGRSRARQGLVPPPRDFTAPGMVDALSREHMVNVVLDGKPGTAMVGWKTRLTRANAEAVVDYIRAEFMQGGRGPANAHPGVHTTAKHSGTNVAYTPPPRGSAKKGVALYRDNCSTCHGMTGEGNGPRAYFIFPKPRNFTSDESRTRFSPDTLFVAVKHGVRGREMPAWGTVLDDQQIADVSQYVYETFVRKP